MEASQVINLLKEKYDILNIKDLIKMFSGNINSVYSFNYNGEKYIFRASKFNNHFEKSVLELLKGSDINVPNIYAYYVINDLYIMIYKYIEGDNPTKANDRLLLDVASQLAIIHNVSCEKLYGQDIEIKETMKKLSENYLSIKHMIEMEERVLIEGLIKSIEIKKEFGELKGSIVHGDIKLTNLIRDKNEVTYIIDFGNCYIGSRMIDIIRTIMWLILIDAKRIEEIKSKIRIFIKKYFESSLKLDEKEKVAINEIIDFCFLYNYVKDKYLHEQGILKIEYIEIFSNRWLNIVKDNEIKNFLIEEIMRYGK